MQRGWVVIVALVLVAGGCSGSSSSVAEVQPVRSLGGAVADDRSLADVVGVELTANRVIAMPCIPSRSDPVGVWIGLQVAATDISDDVFTISIEETDARLGSHPSGCHDPELLLPQSVFLLGADDDTLLAARSKETAGTVMLEFELAGRDPSALDLVVLPTLGYADGADEPRTTVFGLIGQFPLAG